MRGLATGLCAVVLVAVGCSDSQTSTQPSASTSANPTSPSAPSAQPPFASTGACNGVAFWAVSADRSIAVWISTDVSDRSATSVTALRFNLPDPLIQIELQRGQALDQALCGDVIETPPYRLDNTLGAISGVVTLALGPPEACGNVSGTLRVEELVFADGTHPVNFTIDSMTVDCYVG